jgi:hypothetical protein
VTSVAAAPAAPSSAQPPPGTDAPVAPGDNGKETERWRSFRKH